MHHRFSRSHQAPGRHRTLLAWLLLLLALPALAARGPDLRITRRIRSPRGSM